jgi:hypothetical protein
MSELTKISNALNNTTANLNELSSNLQCQIEAINRRIDAIESTNIKFYNDIITEIHQTAVPLINSSIDASKPELRNYINMIIKLELQNRS